MVWDRLIYRDGDTGETVTGICKGLAMSSPVVAPLVSNAITVSRTWMRINAPAGTTAQRSLRTINGGEEGSLLILERDPLSAGNPIVDNTASGNIRSMGNFTFADPFDKMLFLFDGSFWCELSRSNNS